MKLLLTSAGFTNENLVLAAENLLQKSRSDISVGIIDEAYTVEIGDKSWVIKEMASIIKHFSKYVDIIDLAVLDFNEIMNRLAVCDIVYMVGGDTDYLMDVLNKTGIAGKFEDFVGNRLYVGSSAGSMIVGKRAPTEVYKNLFSEGDDIKIANYLEIIPHCIIPHFGERNFDDINADSLTKLSKQYHCRLDGIDNQQAIAYDNGNISYLNGDIFTVDIKQ